MGPYHCLHASFTNLVDQMTIALGSHGTTVFAFTLLLWPKIIHNHEHFQNMTSKYGCFNIGRHLELVKVILLILLYENDTFEREAILIEY